MVSWGFYPKLSATLQAAHGLASHQGHRPLLVIPPSGASLGASGKLLANQVPVPWLAQGRNDLTEAFRSTQQLPHLAFPTVLQGGVVSHFRIHLQAVFPLEPLRGAPGAWAHMLVLCGYAPGVSPRWTSQGGVLLV